MSNNELTGSEDLRFSQLQDFWLAFEPLSHPDHAVSYNLFSVPLGQTKSPTLLIESGSVLSTTGSITIEKEIHVFADETEAFRFLTDLGPENVASYSEAEVEDGILGTTKLIEIHVINHPVIDLNFILQDAELDQGYIVEPFLSGSSLEASGSRVDLEPVTKKIVYDSQERIISDTYLRFFCIETDEAATSPSQNETRVITDGSVLGSSEGGDV